MRAILILALSAWTALSAFATVAQYEVRGVRANDVLNMRAAPTHTAKIVGRIPSNGREIEIIARGKGAWVKVSYGRAQGFVNRRFLALSKPRAARAAPAKAAEDVSPAPVPAAEPTPVPASAPAPIRTESAVTVEPKALDAPPPAAAVPPPPLGTPTKPAAPETALPGQQRDDLPDTPALMKPPAEMMPESVPVPPQPKS